MFPYREFKLVADDPVNSYPRPVPELKIKSDSLPTNHWGQSLFYDRMENANRFINITPWYAIPNNETKNILLNLSGRAPLTNTTQNGDLKQIEEIGELVTINTFSKYDISEVSDYSIELSYPTFKTYLTRGSPFITFVHDKTENFNITIPGITNFKYDETDQKLGRSIVTNNNSAVTTTNYGMINYSGTLRVDNAKWYDGLEIIPEIQGEFKSVVMTSVIINNNTSYNNILIETLGNKILWEVVNHKVTYTKNTEDSPILETVNTSYNLTVNSYILFVKIQGTNNIYTININASETATPQVLSLTYTKIKSFKWRIWSKTKQFRSGDTISFVDPTTPGDTFSGVVSISDNTSFENILTSGQTESDLALSYVKSGISENFISGTDDTDCEFDIKWDIVGTPVLYLTSVWEKMNLTPTTKTDVKSYSLTYGNLTLYKIESNTTKVIFNEKIDKFTFRPNFDDVDLTALETSLYGTSIDEDIYFGDIILMMTGSTRVKVDGKSIYEYGRSVAAAARLLELIHFSGIELNKNANTLLNLILETIILYLTNKNRYSLPPPPTPTNPNPVSCPTLNERCFQLEFEKIWGGVIVPGDYYDSNGENGFMSNIQNEQCKSKIQKYGGAFGNSFYNDHHFHYGYLFYIMYVVELYNKDLYKNYKDQIDALLQDVCNPDKNIVRNGIYTWKTRHKDWYAGHSWATGVPQPNRLPDGTFDLSSGPANRQQESSGESINCYTFAYLLSNLLLSKDEFKNDVDLKSFMSVSEVCMRLEISSVQDYYFMKGDNTQNGIMKKTSCLGLIQTKGKSCTLDWVVNPTNNYNGRMNGIAGIQTLPYTDISKTFIPQDWSREITTYVGNDTSKNEKLEFYSITPELLISIGNSSYTGINTKCFGLTGCPPQPINNPQLSAASTPPGFTTRWNWAAAGLKVLSFGETGSIQNNDFFLKSGIAQNLINNIQKDQAVEDEKDGLENTINLLSAFDSITNTYYWLYRNGYMSKASSNAIHFVVDPEVSIENTDKGPLPIPNCEDLLGEDNCVKVPSLIVRTCFNEEREKVEKVYYQIIDDRCYNKCDDRCDNKRNRDKCDNKKKCLIFGIKPCDVLISPFVFDNNPDISPFVNAPGNNVFEQVANLPGISAGDLYLYAYTKIGLFFGLTGRITLEILRKRFNDKFLRNLKKSRFCAFLEFFERFPYNRYFIE